MTLPQIQITAVADTPIEVFAIDIGKFLQKAGAPLVLALRNDAAFKNTYYHGRRVLCAVAPAFCWHTA